MKQVLHPLEYKYDALEPVIDAKTMEIHHSKHHSTYVDRLNEALAKHPELKMELDEMISNLNKVPEDIRIAVKNNGGGHLNHSLYWEIITPDKKKREFKGEVADAIVKEFGSFEKFKELMIDSGMKRFGSGWAWLVLNKGKLEICSTANQDSPLSEGKKPLLCIDVWEHAYYLKFMNKRMDYLKEIWNVINWKKVDELFL
ncbi:MAG: superoxide dismutase [Nanoarchaeota archaeon]